MKIEEVARPGLIALGVVGIAATALLGFAAGMAVARDPEALRRTARRIARGIEGATLMAAQARERVGDLWAEVREEARADVDAADFERAARAARATDQARTAAAGGVAAAEGAHATEQSTAPAQEQRAGVPAGQPSDVAPEAGQRVRKPRRAKPAAPPESVDRS